MIAYEPRRLQALIEQYMESRASGMSIISVAAASKALRTVMPDVPAGHAALGEMIAASAVKHGYAVSFDLEAGDPTRTAST